MIAKPSQSEVSAYAAGAAAGAIAMLMALLPHLDLGLAAAHTRVSPAPVETLRAPLAGQSLYAAAKIGLPPTD